MRIGIIASARHPVREPFAGGLEMHTHLLASRLRERGHGVTVFASGESDPELGVEPVCPMATELDLSDAASTDPSMLSRGFMEEHHAYLTLMVSLQDRAFDVVQNSSLHYLPISMAPSLPMPVVTTLHTPPTPWLESAVAAMGARRCEGSRPSVFVSVSEDNAGSWRASVDIDRVIHNGVDVDAWPFRARGDAGLAVWTGRVVPEKGPHLAVEAAHAAGLRIVLAGPGGRGGYLEREVLPRLGPGDRYVGHLTQSELAGLVGRAGVVLSTPCWDEPFGLVVVEALACGTPVAAFDRGATVEIVDESCGRLAPAGDVAALASAAREAVQLDRKECRLRAERAFGLDAMVDRYELLYEECASS